MRKRMLSKILAALLAGVMVVGTVACGNTTANNNQESTAQKESNVESVATTPTEAVVEEPTELTYPLTDAEKLSIWYSPSIAEIYSSMDESPFHQGLEKNTGVDVEWEGPAKGLSLSEALTLLYTETKLPNVIITHQDAADGVELLEDDVIYDLKEYLPKYAPDYWQYLNDNNLVKEVSTDAGQMPFFYGFIEGDFNKTYIGPIIRKDWLDECGLEMPETLEDWENVLVTFKEKYNAVLTVPFALPFEGADSFFASGMNAYTTLNNSYYIDDNGKVQNAMLQPEWLEYMTLLNKWYDMGLMDIDILTADRNIIRSKMLNNEVGVTFTAMSQLTNYIADAEAENTGAEFAAVTYPVKNKGDNPQWIQTAGGNVGNISAVITKSCSEEELITALQFLNYAFTEEGMMYYNFGTEGETYTVNAQGDIELTALITEDPDGLTQAIRKYAGMDAANVSVQLARMVQLKNNPAATEAVYTWIKGSEAGKHVIPTGLSYTLEESSELADLSAAIDTYAKETATRFLTGVEPLSNYEKFVETMESMNVDRIIEIYQAVYDRYMAR